MPAHSLPALLLEKDKLLPRSIRRLLSSTHKWIPVKMLDDPVQINGTMYSIVAVRLTSTPCAARVNNTDTEKVGDHLNQISVIMPLPDRKNWCATADVCKRTLTLHQARNKPRINVHG